MKDETLLPDVASLEKVLEWIAGLPVPTKSATANYCRLKNFIIDYNAAIQSGNSGQPAGYVLVPVEPTVAILDEIDAIFDFGAEDSKDAWHRLLAAAPKITGSQLTPAPGWTDNSDANAALVMLDRIDTLDPADDDRIEEVKRIIRSLAAPKAPDGWIPVSERMPLDISHEEFRSMTAIVTDGLCVGMCDCQSGNGWVEWSNYGDINPEKITHWQPLPDAPKVTP